MTTELIIMVTIIAIAIICGVRILITLCIKAHYEETREDLLLEFLEENRELTQVPNVGNVRNIATMTDDIEIMDISIETTSTTIRNLGLKEVIKIRSKDIEDHV